MTELTRDGVLDILNSEFKSEWYGDTQVFYEQIDEQKFIAAIKTEQEMVFGALRQNQLMDMITIIGNKEVIKKFSIYPMYVHVVLDNGNLKECDNLRMDVDKLVTHYPFIYTIIPSNNGVALCPFSGGKVLQSYFDEDGNVIGAYRFLPILQEA